MLLSRQKTASEAGLELIAATARKDVLRPFIQICRREKREKSSVLVPKTAFQRRRDAEPELQTVFGLHGVTGSWRFSSFSRLP